jgi:hypothetical protein
VARWDSKCHYALSYVSVAGGGPFDPLNFSSRPEEFVDQTVKEIKNGRLAMVAMLGYFAQVRGVQQCNHS